MTIKRKDFDSGKFNRSYTIKEHPIGILLKANIQLAFTVDEVAKRTKMNKQTVRSMLRKLKEKGQIVHKSPYFAWKK